VTRRPRITITGPSPEGATAQPGHLEDYLDRARDAELDAARDQGHADGQAEALAGAAAALSEAAEALDASRSECVDEISRVAVELGLGIARSLVRAELAADQHDIEAIVRDVLAATTERRTTTQIHVSPSDAERLAGVTFRAATEVTANEGVSVGSVRVETPQGVLVRDIDESMRAIADRLMREVSK